MADYLVTDIELTNIANAIRAKAGGSSSLEFPTEFISAINNIPVKTASVQPNDVNFIDYDGTIVASYSAADFANLSALPDNPTHDGLTAQGWNWTLADAKVEVVNSGFLDIGQMYTTSDGKTRLYITLSEGRLYPRLYLNQTVGRGVEIDWGDGSTIETLSGTGTKSGYHLYPSAGNYVITLNVISGTMLLGGTSSSSAVFSGDPLNYYRSILWKVELGKNASINSYGFYNLYGLQSVSVPSTALNFGSFYYCTSLRFITIPSGANIGSFRACYSLHHISLPKSATLSTDVFRSVQALKRVVIPQVTSIPSRMFDTETALTKLTIPSTVTSIGDYAFYSCTGMAEYHFKPTAPPSLGTTVFYNIPSNCKIYVPSGSLSNYQSATNWSDFSSYMVGE